MTRQRSAPIVVVGAGVIGLSAALHLREAFPDREVVVLDSGRVGDGTTPAGAGFVARWATVLPHLGASGLALADYSLDFYRRLAADGGDLRFRDNGNLVLFNERASMDATVDLVTASPLYADDNRIVDASEVGELTGGAVDTNRVAGGIFMPSGIQFETGRALALMAEKAVAAGVEIREHARVESVRASDGRVAGIEIATPDGESQQLETDVVVLAVGAWLDRLLASVGWRLPLLPFVATRFVTEDVGVPADTADHPGEGLPPVDPRVRGRLHMGIDPRVRPRSPAGR